MKGYIEGIWYSFFNGGMKLKGIKLTGFITKMRCITFTEITFFRWMAMIWWWCIYIDGLVQERHNSIANALELYLSYTKPLICLCRWYGLSFFSDLSRLRYIAWSNIYAYCIQQCSDWGMWLADICKVLFDVPSSLLYKTHLSRQLNC